MQSCEKFQKELNGLFYPLAIGLILSMPLIIKGIPVGTDTAHHYRMAIGFYDCLKQGDPYPSWFASTNNGYGDPSVRFYPPLFYWLLSISNLLTQDWYFASIVTFVLLNILASVGVYLWARQLTDSSFAVAAPIFYLLSPFHANQLYQSTLYTQYASMSLLPLLFALVESILAQPKWRSSAAFGLLYALFFIINMPITVIGSLSLAIYFLARFFQTRNQASLQKISFGVVIGLLLSCFYWMTVVFELQWKYPSGAPQGEWYNYTKNFLFSSSLKQYLLIILLATFGTSAITPLYLFYQQKRVCALSVLALFSFLMSTVVSKPLWDILPPLQETQFPWRWLSITSLSLSILATISLPQIFLLWQKKRILVATVVVITLSSLCFTVFRVIRPSVLLDRRGFLSSIEMLGSSPTNKDFLTIWAKPVQPMSSLVEAKNRTVSSVNWLPEVKTFHVTAGQTTDARLKLYYYPHWIATSNGEKLETKPASDGAILVKLPPREAEIKVVFKEPITSKISLLVSSIAFLFVLIIIVIKREAI
ncbi:MAG: glycosyltransferase family 39 protein [Blastocatellia bacterium]|nr:glycosyltransferase family 39 protein [Blastocatellia bacterium]